MPSNVSSETPLSLGERQAVELLLEKVGSGSTPTDQKLRDSVQKAADQALARWGEDDGRFEGGEQKAFYHGLLTGYAVASCLLDQQERSPRGG